MRVSRPGGSMRSQRSAHEEEEAHMMRDTLPTNCDIGDCPFGLQAQVFSVVETGFNGRQRDGGLMPRHLGGA